MQVPQYLGQGSSASECSQCHACVACEIQCSNCGMPMMGQILLGTANLVSAILLPDLP